MTAFLRLLLLVLLSCILSACPRASVDNPLHPDMVALPASEALLGNPPQRISVEAFLLDRTEVTSRAYAACVKVGRCSLPVASTTYCNYDRPDRLDHPINCVSWDQAVAYCRWRGKRLPFAVEWERAARFTDGRAFPWGAQAPTCALAIFRSELPQAGCGKDGTWPVASLPQGRSQEGAFDLAGNVAEWILDCPSSPSSPCPDRHTRGGSWQSVAPFLQAYQSASFPSDRGGPLLGFRCALGKDPIDTPKSNRPRRSSPQIVGFSSP